MPNESAAPSSLSAVAWPQRTLPWTSSHTWAAPFLRRLIISRRLQDLYDRCCRHTDASLWETVLRELGVHYVVSDLDVRRIPRTGPTVIVANHPCGMLEGAVLAQLMLQVRPDVRVLTNQLLAEIPQLRDACIGVDPFGGPGATWANRRGLREAKQWLHGGGLLVTFPAGEVATWRTLGGEISDPPWSDSISRLTRSASAALVPVYVEGSNSLGFHLLGSVHPRLRTLRLPHELLNKVGMRMRLRVGQAIRAQDLGINPATVTAQARARTELLGYSLRETPPVPRHSARRLAVAPAPLASQLFEEIAGLPSSALLCEDRCFQVWRAMAADIPKVMGELARQREITFRAVGEGTGARLDCDRFDTTYEHLILWDRQAQAVAGSYRVGRVQELLQRQGREGLYTATLFDFDPDFFGRVGPTLELGRSFVARNYQRQYNSLLCLWKGLARYAAEERCAPVLMGAVSMSQTYKAASRALVRAYVDRRAGSLHRAVRGRVALDIPASIRPYVHTVCEGLADWHALNAAVADLESDGAGLPVLLRHYLKLGGDMVATHVDRGFGDCLDILVVLDLRRREGRMLERLMA